MLSLDTDNILPAILTIIASFAASSGFWAWFSKRSDKNSAVTRLVMGLAHDRIIFLGSKYIDRGWITKDEYEDLNTYLYEPYSQFGGNGLAKKVMLDVEKLPMKVKTTSTPASSEYN